MVEDGTPGSGPSRCGDFWFNDDPALTAMAARVANECLAARAGCFARILKLLYDDGLARHGSSLSEFSELATIQSMQTRATAVALARCHGVDKSTVSRDLARLESRHLIRRDEEGRYLPIQLSQNGIRKFLECVPAWEAAQSKALAVVGSAGAVQLLNMAAQASALRAR